MNLSQLMKQAQQMQDKLKRELAETVVEADAGGGMVTVRMNGHKQVLGVKIDPEVLSPEEGDVLEDLVQAAVNAASAKVDSEMQGKIGGMASGLPWPL